MRTISVQDLHERTEEIVADVQKAEVHYVVKSGDHLVALVSPVKIEPPPSAAEPEEASGEGWESYSRLAEDVRARWPGERDSQELLHEIRR